MHTITTRTRFARLVIPLVVLSASTAGCDIAMAHLNEKETAELAPDLRTAAGRSGRDQQRQRENRRRAIDREHRRGGRGKDGQGRQPGRRQRGARPD